MRNMFIISVESCNNVPPSAEGIKLALERHYGRFNGVRFTVEEGGHREVATLVSDYLSAEEALEKFKSIHEIDGKCSLDSQLGHEWKVLYDTVMTTRRTLVGKLHEYGAVV